MDVAREQGVGQVTEPVMTAPEAESLIEGLRTFTLDEVGDPAWMRQLDHIQRLNMQAHQNAMLSSDEFVVEALLSFDKLGVLIHELIAIELWKEKVLPEITNDLKGVSTIKLYMVAYHEASICNLLEVVLYHKDALIGAGESVVELADYCVRKLNILNTCDRGYYKPTWINKTSKEYLDATKDSEIGTQIKEIEFGCSMTVFSFLTSLTQHLNELPLGVVSRLLVSNDLPVLLAPLVLSPPWVHREKGKVYKYNDSQWSIIPQDDILKLAKPEAHVWMTLYNILMDENARKKYELTDYRKEQVLKVRKLLNEIILDQLPILGELLRYLEALSMQTVESSPSSSFIIEQVMEMRDNLASAVENWKALADRQRKEHFAESRESYAEDMKRMANMYNLDQLEDLLEDPKCARCGNLAAKRCSRCQNEWYCGRECQVKQWKQHKPMCDLIANDRKLHPRTGGE